MKPNYFSIRFQSETIIFLIKYFINYFQDFLFFQDTTLFKLHRMLQYFIFVNW